MGFIEIRTLGAISEKGIHVKLSYLLDVHME